MACAIFGNMGSQTITESLLENYIERTFFEGHASTFLIGNNTEFDLLALTVLRRLNKSMPSLRYKVVPAFIPSRREMEFLRPEELAPVREGKKLSRKKAIRLRNRMMVQEADVVLAYIRRPFSPAGNAVRYAKRAGREIIKMTVKYTPEPYQY